MKVYLRDGTEEYLLIHIEVQGYEEEGFAKRMYVYNYKIFDRYGANVVSLAILVDEIPTFRENEYSYKRWGFEYTFRFPLVKIIDYKDRIEELEKDDNPFAIIVLAHLREMETRKDIRSRLFWKITLVKALYKKGYNKEDILLLYSFIDWLISLPEKENEIFHEEIVRFEEVKKMAYITTAERIGMKKGMEKGIKEGMEKGRLESTQEAVIDAVEVRFNVVPEDIANTIKEIKDMDVLKDLLKKAIRSETLDEFKTVLKAIKER